ncbi:methyltransferase domain-containing protein [Bradyrhizobium cenepequi]|uniref:methyltransferase domain-containing protein n=1 Tax=Bradyrhizobium cenepequi TaxID=2821403 RepID=UPI001CE358B2|nr:methyltransferase domain-containing protein [Bradyrhizobium cenepequi]MCA6111607.1 methyltransferase domain-containing protein [Bradyrhizobium cenepequi]
MNTFPKTKAAPRDLSRRSAESEWLDGADASAQELALVLRDLARFNRVMLGHWPVIDWLRRATKDAGRERALTLVDVGCGYGDLLRAIRRWARKRGLTIRLIGLDLNRETVRIAQAVTDDADEIDYCVVDVFDFAPPAPIDLVVSSLVTHHMSDDLIVKFLRWMEGTARKGWLIYDLQRHPVPYYFIGVMGKLTRLHPMVIHDGRISVARSLTRTEWLMRIDEADIARNAVRLRWFLFRFAIGRLR